MSKRSNFAHAYNQDVALSIVRHAKDSYYPLFKALQDEFAARNVEEGN